MYATYYTVYWLVYKSSVQFEFELQLFMPYHIGLKAEYRKYCTLNTIIYYLLFNLYINTESQITSQLS